MDLPKVTPVYDLRRQRAEALQALTQSMGSVEVNGVKVTLHAVFVDHSNGVRKTTVMAVFSGGLGRVVGSTVKMRLIATDSDSPQVKKLESQLGEAKKLFTDSSPEMAAVRQQLAEARKHAIGELPGVPQDPRGFMLSTHVGGSLAYQPLSFRGRHLVFDKVAIDRPVPGSFVLKIPTWVDLKGVRTFNGYATFQVARTFRTGNLATLFAPLNLSILSKEKR